MWIIVGEEDADGITTDMSSWRISMSRDGKNTKPLEETKPACEHEWDVPLVNDDGAYYEERRCKKCGAGQRRHLNEKSAPVEDWWDLPHWVFPHTPRRCLPTLLAMWANEKNWFFVSFFLLIIFFWWRLRCVFGFLLFLTHQRYQMDLGSFFVRRGRRAGARGSLRRRILFL